MAKWQFVCIFRWQNGKCLIFKMKICGANPTSRRRLLKQLSMTPPYLQSLSICPPPRHHYHHLTHRCLCCPYYKSYLYTFIPLPNYIHNSLIVDLPYLQSLSISPRPHHHHHHVLTVAVVVVVLFIMNSIITVLVVILLSIIVIIQTLFIILRLLQKPNHLCSSQQ